MRIKCAISRKVNWFVEKRKNVTQFIDNVAKHHDRTSFKNKTRLGGRPMQPTGIGQIFGVQYVLERNQNRDPRLLEVDQRAKSVALFCGLFGFRVDDITC